jgi:hypothetical protein
MRINVGLKLTGMIFAVHYWQSLPINWNRLAAICEYAAVRKFELMAVMGRNCSLNKELAPFIFLSNLAFPERPSAVGGEWQLSGDEYEGMKVGNILLIQIVLSYCLRFWRFDTLENH